jgi:hypothetical protein
VLPSARPAKNELRRLFQRPLLLDWSLFRIATGRGAGLPAGNLWGTIFRGFAMTTARDAGALAAP